MITKNEISSLNLSPTKKDFVQIWNELIEVASKITERWDPTSTNESDPGIVLLKVLAGIADKLNYNIDKNILEAFMPTAAQMESMRNLCELVGYDIKYYQSAETKVRIKYTGNTTDISEENEERLPDTGLAIPKFTTITNADKDITFVTTNSIPVLLTNTTPWVEVGCIEGQLSQCESINENNLITLSQLDDNNRYYLPEIQIAENGVFVYNANATIKNGVTTVTDGTLWEQVSNLNTQAAETRIFKFGYDSFEGRPYLAFPDDIGSLIGDGLFIYFIRTSGLGGNISPRTLEMLELPTGDGWENYSAEQFEVVNPDATTNGANIESISTAYNNFQKTVGTFDTLVTCRDYMNKIYSLMDMSNSPYVSNILVTDIRNDINNAYTLCSCNEFGILYKETPITRTVEGSNVTRTAVPLGNNVYKLVVEQDRIAVEEPLIDHFDLILYPFKTFTQVSSGTKDLVTPYNQSFTYTEQKSSEITAALADFKTCAHNFKEPKNGDIVAINNYLRLNALIATSSRVSEQEAQDILKNVRVALVNEFNLRNLDFGEEIPFESILSVIENADLRIKVVSLQEPTVLTTYSVKEGATSKEYAIASMTDTTGKPIKIDGVEYGENEGLDKAKDIYNKLVLRNILAGRASLFDYDETFIPNNSEKPYTITEAISDYDTASLDFPVGEHILPGEGPKDGVLTLKVNEDGTKTVYETYKPSFKPNTDTPISPPTDTPADTPKDETKTGIISNISRIEALCEVSSTSEKGVFSNVTLGKNEVIKFRAPNLITTQTFPAYVYYRFERGDTTGNRSTQDAGRYADCVQLTEFVIDAGETPFFTELWRQATIGGVNDNNLPSITATIKLKKVTVDGKVTVEVVEESDKINQSNRVPSMFKEAMACGIITTKKDGANNQDIIDEVIQVFASEAAFYKYLEDTKNEAIGNLSADSNKDEDEIVRIFRYYPLNARTMDTWSACIRVFDSSLPAGTTLWRLSSTSNYPKGKLVTVSTQRLFAQSSDYLINNNVGEVTYICKDLGEDPKYSSIADGSDIELRPNDKLYIHYTPSSTNEDGETVNAESVSIIYTGSEEEPLIIKPSGFALMPTADVLSTGVTPKKKVDFGDGGPKELLALAPNEQIELRSLSRVTLNTTARFYKNFDNEGLENGSLAEYELKDGEYLFYTDKNAQEAAYYGSGSVITLDRGAFIPKASERVEVSQILEHGLHIVPWSDYVTLNNNKKITITEYQYITLTEGDILNNLTLDTSDEKNQPSKNKAGHYVIGNKRWTKCLSTTESPIVYTLAGAKTETILPKIDLISPSSTSWEVCSFLELSTSPGYTQQLRATQAIQDYTTTSVVNKLNVYAKPDSTDAVEELVAEITPKETVMAADNKKQFEPVSIKLNTIVQSASGTFKKQTSETTDTVNVDDATTVNVQMKVFKEEAPAKVLLANNSDTFTPISEKEAVTVDANVTSLNNYWTRIDIKDLRRANNDTSATALKTLPNALSLNFMIPDNSDLFGIFSIYLDTSTDGLAGQQLEQPNDPRVFIDVPQEFGLCSGVVSRDDALSEFSSYNGAISIFNYENIIENNKYFWWSNGVDNTPNRLYLRAGLNCIKITKSCSLLIKAGEAATGAILYDNMKLVKGREVNGINLELLDPDATFNVRVAQGKPVDRKALANNILEKINSLDKNHDFYYNAPIENSLVIEFNDNINSFSNPHTLYDINNINNTFVISKLDVNYLKDGLSIAKSSKY
jgi:hypothetical protein